MLSAKNGLASNTDDSSINKSLTNKEWTPNSPENTSYDESFTEKDLDSLRHEISEELEWETRSNLCGWGPSWMQRFRSPEVILLLLCGASLAQGFIVNGLVNVVISTIERRYQMRSTEIGVIAGGYDIASLILLMPVSYFGGTRRKPLFISSGVIVMGLGALVFSSPYFVSGKYEFSVEIPRTCSQRNNTSCVVKEETSYSNYKYLFFFGQFLHGAGATPLWTLGCAYIDENVSSKLSSMYIGIYYTMAVIGPGLGYIIGGQFLQIYVDFLYVNEEDIGLTLSSDVWVGAWWVGFLLGAAFCFTIALPIAALPKLLPGNLCLAAFGKFDAYSKITFSVCGKLFIAQTSLCLNTTKVLIIGSKALRAKQVVEVHKTMLTSKAMEKGFGRTLSDFPMSLWILASNPAFIFLSLAGATEGLLSSALAAFTPKIVEQQFHTSPSYSALLVGLISLPSAAGGTFLGGYLVKRFDLKMTAILKYTIGCTFIALCTSFAFLISCESSRFAGITISYGDEEFYSGNLSAKCNQNCGCSKYEYDPICGVDNIAYFSPCYAGCNETNFFQGSKVYSNCSCIQHSKNKFFKMKPSYQNTSIDAYRSKCEVDCNRLPTFLFFVSLSIFFTFLISMPSLTATMRCVVQSQKSFALGLQWIIVRVFGTIPAPFIFGKSIDMSCISWKSSCESDSTGACLLYDNRRLSLYLTVLIISLKLLSVIFFGCVLIFYKPPDSMQSQPHSTERQKTPTTGT